MSVNTLKGGDLTFVSELNGYFVRAHSRSKVFFPVEHTGNRPLAVKLSDLQISNAVKIDEDAAPLIDRDNYQDVLLKFVASHKSSVTHLEVASVPRTIMKSRFVDAVFIADGPSLKVALLNEDAGLSLLLRKTVASINEKVAINQHKLTAVPGEDTLRGAPIKDADVQSKYEMRP